MTPMYRPGSAAVMDDQAAVEADVVRVTAISRSVPVAVVVTPTVVKPTVVKPTGRTGVVKGRALPCANDPDLFFAESPVDVELAKSLCGGCPARAQGLAR